MKKIIFSAIATLLIANSADASVASTEGVQTNTMVCAQSDYWAYIGCRQQQQLLNEQIMYDKLYKAATTQTANSNVCLSSGCTAQAGAIKVSYMLGEFPTAIEGLNFKIDNNLASEFLTIDEKNTLTTSFNYTAEFVRFMFNKLEIPADQINFNFGKSSAPKSGSYYLEDMILSDYGKTILGISNSSFLSKEGEEIKVLSDELEVEDQVIQDYKLKRFIKKAQNTYKETRADLVTNWVEDTLSKKSYFGFGTHHADYYLTIARYLQFVYVNNQPLFKTFLKEFFDSLKAKAKSVRQMQEEEVKHFFSRNKNAELFRCNEEEGSVKEIVSTEDALKFFNNSADLKVNFYKTFKSGELLLKAKYFENEILSFDNEQESFLLTPKKEICENMQKVNQKFYPSIFIQKAPKKEAPGLYNVFNRCEAVKSDLVTKYIVNIHEAEDLAHKLTSKETTLNEKVNLHKSNQYAIKYIDHFGKNYTDSLPGLLFFEDDQKIYWQDIDGKTRNILFKDKQACEKTLAKAGEEK